MQNILRNIILAPVVLAAAVVATNTAKAEVTVKVPFSFTAAGKQCAAGTYIVQRDRQHSLITLKNTDASQGFNWIVGPGDGVTDSLVTLKFDENGQNHTLRQIEYGSQKTGILDKKRGKEQPSMQILQGN